MRKSLTLLLVLTLLLSAALVSGCSKESSEILIGNIQDLSGPNKAFGLGMTNAAQAYIEKVNAAGGINGKKLKLISYDTKSEVNEAINAYRRLVDQDKVLVIMGPPIANMGIALAPITEEKKVPIIGLYVDERATTKPDGKPYKYMFLAQNSSGTQARTIAAYAMKELKVKTFAMLYNQQNAYSVSLAQPFEAYVKANGGMIVAKETFTNADKDYRTQLTKIKQANPEAIYMPNYPQEIPLTLQQAYDLGIKSTILGDNSFIPFALPGNTDPKASEGVIFPNNIDPNDPKLKDWANAYKAKFNVDPVAQSYTGEDAFGILVEAIKRAGSKATPEAVATELSKTGKYPGLQGTVTLSPNTHRPEGLPMPIIQVKDGKMITLTTYNESGK